MAMTEQEVAASVTAYFGERGAEVYHEVAPGGGGAPRADVVAVFRTPGGAGIVHVIECKTSLSLRVLDQAVDWIGQAHHVSVAIPFRRGRGYGRAAGVVLHHQGIGLLEANGPKWCVQQVRSRFCRRPIQADRVLNACVPETRAGAAVLAAGSAGGGYSTPFSRTLAAFGAAVRRLVQDEGGPVTMKRAIEETRHHYASDRGAASTLAYWLERGRVPGVEVVIVKGKRRVGVAATEAR